MAHAAIGSSAADDIARQFVAARCQDRVLMRYPGGLMPETLEDGYRIQDSAIAIDGRALIGWKVGRIGEPSAANLGSNRLAGPIFAMCDARDFADACPTMPVLSGFAAAEGELLARIAPDAIDARARGDLTGMIDALHLGIEIASSPFIGINGNGPAVTVSDFGNNHGAVLGPDLLHRPLNEIFDAQMTVSIDDVEVGRGRPVDILDGPLGSISFILDHMRRRKLGDPSGLWVSCGAVTGVHPVAAGSVIEARLLDAIVRCSASPLPRVAGERVV